MARQRRKAAPQQTKPAQKENIVLKKDITKALEAVKPGIAGCNDLSDQSELVIFADDKLISFNDQLSISYPIQTGLTGSIYANEILQFVKKAPENEIKIELDESNEKGNQFIFQSGKVKAGFYISIVDPPKLDIGKKWEELPPNFSDAISLCYPTAATKSDRGVLTCIQITDNLVISCNNYQASKYQLADCPVSGLIQAESAKILAAFKPVDYQKGTGSWNHYRSSDNAIISILSIEEEYPTDKVMSLFAIDGESIELPDNLKEVIERQEIMATDSDSSPLIEIKINKNTMEFNATNIKGWISETVEMAKNKKELSFHVNPITLKSVLADIQDVTVNESILKIDSDIFSYAIALKV